jgi:hypothetical protein
MSPPDPDVAAPVVTLNSPVSPFPADPVDIVIEPLVPVEPPFDVVTE